MDIYSRTTYPKPPKTADSGYAAYLYAAILVVMALTQLFSFDEFIKLFTTFGIIGGELVARLMGGIMVICEVFAIPFLLRMRLSKHLRIISMIMGWLVVFGWLKIVLWQNIVPNSVMNVGLLGTIVQLSPGWWAVPLIVALGMLDLWSSWGLWPISRYQRRGK